MIEHNIKAATCRVSCGTESGTGWLIAQDLVITARHCILQCIDESRQVELLFPDSTDVCISSKILAQSEDWDVCLLSLENTSTAEPLPLSSELPHEGETWQTFGYPKGKTTLGHRLSGTIAQVLATPKLKIDLDLSIGATEGLQDYRGMSGATVVCDDGVVGMIRLKVDGTVAALSLNRLASFLAENGVALADDSATSSAPLLADRGDFPQAFAEAVQARAGNYLFLEGAHGYGKSTFCGSFDTDDKELINLGAYCLSDPSSALGADYRAQPQVFLDWLATRISGLITGRPPRKLERSYAEQIRDTAQYLEKFSNYCAQSGRKGMFFIDGLNEIPVGPLLVQFFGLLPAKLPEKIIVVLTAPNLANLAATLAGKVKTNDVLQLPPLSEAACYQYCRRALMADRQSPGLIDRICERAKGNPLYLRYLIEYANHQPADDELNDFPILKGTIEEYYQGIWAKLLPDADAVSMLALMARLRWGVPLSDFAKALNQAELSQFESVISRIRHLLANEQNTTIYHASFASFIDEQTGRIDAAACARLAEFCCKAPEVRYCTLNRVFHLLRAGDNAVFSACSQAWFDTAVTLGVEPDALIADVDAVIKRAAIEAPVDEFIRLTLLGQRISFRYDTLFAQSARLIAEALIVIGRPGEALQHVLRIKTLIVNLDDALQIGFLLHRNGYDDEARTLLDQVLKRIVANYDAPMPLGHFLDLCSWHIQTVFLLRLADGWNGMQQVMAIMDMARHACDEALQNDPSKLDLLLRPILARPLSYFLTFRDEYADLSSFRAFHEKANRPQVEPPAEHAQTLCMTLLSFEEAVDAYHLPKSRKAIANLFADLAELSPSSDIDTPLAVAITDILVRFGAPTNIVEIFASKSGKAMARPLRIIAKNGVDVDHKDLQECLCQWRVAAFFDSSFRGPSAGVIHSTGWLDSIEHLIGELFCHDGRARRAKADGDDDARVLCCHQLKTQVIEPLRFTLQQRADWSDSYAIPENSLPGVYRQLAELLSDCFPEELPWWLDSLVASADGQWGMYSEGFRTSVFFVLKELTREKPSEPLTTRLLHLLHAWRDHVLGGVENRHELVPEILRMIPVFSSLGATEEPESLYQRLLSVSMGPTWYKEDQLGIMTDVLGSIASNMEIEQRLPRVAGYLERASGEMTFQRYVRAEKSSLLAQVARHGKYHAALAYFRRQCCGSTAELWAEGQQGRIDKVGSLKGNRFPGGAIDDQAAILALVRNSGKVSWVLRWALLEIFHCGDDRHLTDYAEAFAKIANEVGAAPDLVRRAEIVAKAETPRDDCLSFTSAFRRALKPELHATFAPVLAGIPPSRSPEPPEPLAKREAEADDRIDGLFQPGLFGRQEALQDADELLVEAERQWTLGNRQAAKAQAVRVLKTAQDGGWGIWGNLSSGARRAEEILILEETSAADVIRYYAPLIHAEHYEPKWIPAQHLIAKIGPLLTESESERLLDAVIEHIRLVVGDASQDIQDFGFLAADVPDRSPTIECFEFIVWLCNHPKWLRRERAAAMLLWIVEQAPELFSEAVTTAFSMNEGYGPDVLCGVLDGASAREPGVFWDKIASVLDLTKVVQELRHVSRMAVLERLATRAEKVGSSSAKSASSLIKASLNGKRGTGGNPKLPIWASCLAREWGQLGKLLDTESVAAWEKELEQLCSPLRVTDALTLEAAVSTSFRERPNRSLNRWESKLRHALNLALWARLSHRDVTVVEASLRSYNPSQPERSVQGRRNPFTDQLMASIKSGDYSAVFGSNATVMLSYHDMAVNPTEDGLSEVEVLCLLQPTSNQWGFFGPQLEQSFRSSELPVASTVRTPFETCCRLDPEVVFLGPFTPAKPLSFFQNFVGAKDDVFVRQNWRYGRRHDFQLFGQPEREGCSLSVARRALKVPSGLKLAWMIWVDGETVAFVDERNNRLG